MHVPTLKPIDAVAVTELADTFGTLHVVENHSVIGGLASAVAEVVAGAGVRTTLRSFGLPDAWAPAGSLDYIRSELGLSADLLADRIAASVSDA